MFITEGLTMKKKVRLTHFGTGFVFALVFSCLIHTCSAQRGISLDSLRERYGAFVHFNFNNHRADFRALPGVPNCCPQFEEGDGTGWTFGLLYGLPLSRELILDLRAGYVSRNALLRKTEPITVSGDGFATQGLFEHTIDVKLSSVGFEPLLQYRLYGKLNFLAGFRAAYLVKNTYDQKESLIEPAEFGTFENGRRTRNESSGEIPNVNPYQGSFLAGASYEFPLDQNKTWFGALEFFYSIGFTRIVKDLSWFANSIRLGVALKWSPVRNEQFSESITPSKSIKTSARTSYQKKEPGNNGPELRGNISILNASANTDESAVTKIRIEEFNSIQMRPLLPYVFFDENSAILHSRYVQLSAKKAKEFHINHLHKLDVLSLYHQILNIIGRRLTDNPKAMIALVGCNSDSGIETGNIRLSQQRAEAVRDYFQNVWNIPVSRIKIESRGLPEKYSYPTDSDGIAENRRVEIHSDTWEILEPITTKEILKQVTPDIIKLRVNAHAETGIQKWSLLFQQGSESFMQFSGSGQFPEKFEWALGKGIQNSLDPDVPIIVSSKFEDSTGQWIKTNTVTILVEYVSVQKKEQLRLADKIIEQYNLILFDFDSFDFNWINERISGIITKQIKPTSTVMITGYTDRMGSEERNLHLSENRAKSTAKMLNVASSRASGKGEVLLYDNDLPEGRSYNRTVDIIIETPIER